MEFEINPFKRPMTELQKKWYRLLLARRFGFGGPRNPSNHLEVTYQMICQERYKESFRKYNKKFRDEVRKMESMQPSAIDAMRVHRTFSITTLWPPLHSKCEINLTLDLLEKVLDVKERRRLEGILKREYKRI